MKSLIELEAEVNGREGRSIDKHSLEYALDHDDYKIEIDQETKSSQSNQNFISDLQIENRRLSLSLNEMQLLANNARKAIEILENKCCRFQAEIVSLQNEINQMNGNDIHNKNLEYLTSLEHNLRSALDKVVRQKETLKSNNVVDDSRLCVICHDGQKSVLLLPCRHLCVCINCGHMERLNQCPLCRQKIEETLQVYS